MDAQVDVFGLNSLGRQSRHGVGGPIHPFVKLAPSIQPEYLVVVGICTRQGQFSGPPLLRGRRVIRLKYWVRSSDIRGRVTGSWNWPSGSSFRNRRKAYLVVSARGCTYLTDSARALDFAPFVAEIGATSMWQPA